MNVTIIDNLSVSLSLSLSLSALFGGRWGPRLQKKLLSIYIYLELFHYSIVDL